MYVSKQLVIRITGMNLSVNRESQVPPGFRFHPTEEELLHYYLRKKVASEKIDLDVIHDVDLNKLEPWDIQEKCNIGSTSQNDWYFFSHKDKKYPTGTRTNRATTAGFWKATGRDKVIYSSLRRIGMRKTLVFYMGRAPHGQKSDWIMHEYRLEENNTNNTNISDSMSEDGWVVCRVFRKKNYQRSLESPKKSFIGSRNHLIDLSKEDGVADHILLYMGRNCKEEHENFSKSTINTICSDQNLDNNHCYFTTPNITSRINEDRFMHLPSLASPTFNHLSIDEMFMNETDLSPPNITSRINEDRFMHLPSLDSPTFNHLSIDEMCMNETDLSPPSTSHATGTKPELIDWDTLDRLVASQLNGDHVLNEPSRQLSCFGDTNMPPFTDLSSEHDNAELSRQLCVITTSEIDLWSFTRSRSSSSSDPISHLSI